MAFNFGGAGAGAISGGSAGAALGPYGAAGGALLGGLIGGFTGGETKPQETKIQKQQRHLVDQLIGSLNGSGPYADLFSPDEATFQKSYVEPAMSRFKNQTVPAIQQSYVGGQYGAQRGGTGMEDTLTRAGVDMDQLINQAYGKYVEQSQGRRMDALSKILGQGSGAEMRPSYASQYFGGEGVRGDISAILKSLKGDETSNSSSDNLLDTYLPTRQGFERDNQVYDPYRGVMQ